MAKGKCKCGNVLTSRSRQCPKCKSAYMKRWRRTHPLKMTAAVKLRMQCRQVTKYLILRGVLKRQPCEICGAVKVEAHHEDYTKPFEVRWLCKWDHAQVTSGRLVLEPKVHPAVVCTYKPKGESLTKQEIEALRWDIRTMTYDSPLYKILKEELSVHGWWKNRPRGRSDARYFRGKVSDES